MDKIDLAYILITSEEERAKLFEELEKQGMTKLAMHGSVQACVDDFLAMTNIAFAMTIVAYDRNNHNKPACYAVVSPVQNKSGMLHFCMFRPYFEYSEMMGKKIIEMFWNLGFESLYGLTPKPFRHVFELARKIGFSIRVAELKGACYLGDKDKYVSGVISIINKK